MTPRRIQRRRTRGWRMPEGAISVTRPGRWGNPFSIGGWFKIGDPKNYRGPFRMEWCETAIWQPSDEQRAIKEGFVLISNARMAVELYRQLVATRPAEWSARVCRELAGHDLACWCSLCPEHAAALPLGVRCEACMPCHADELLRIANR